MHSTILAQLGEIAINNNIQLLYSCESGSRGWQFPSPDSDYDVRFIYCRPYDYYLSVLDRSYDLKFPINDELDVYGWDIRKVLKLILRSNTTPFEWLQSPIIYVEVEGFKNELWHLCQSFFSQKANIHHYLGIARGALDSMVNDNEITIKKLFYVLRPLLSAKWCLEKNGIAPMTIGPLMTLLPPQLQQIVTELITLKATLEEKFIISINAELKNYIDDEYARITTASRVLERNEFSALKLDEFFLKTIRQYDY
jgi:predicted nucleotidyltransferase